MRRRQRGTSVFDEPTVLVPESTMGLMPCARWPSLLAVDWSQALHSGSWRSWAYSMVSPVMGLAMLLEEWMKVLGVAMSSATMGTMQFIGGLG